MTPATLLDIQYAFIFLALSILLLVGALIIACCNLGGRCDDEIERLRDEAEDDRR